MNNLSRRLFVRALGLSAAGVAVPAAALATIPVPTGPITPIEYVEEMLAAGWQPVAAIDPTHQKPIGVVFEFAPDGWTGGQPRLSRKRDVKDAGFWPRVSQILFERGMTDANHPRTKDEWWRIRRLIEFRQSLPEQFTPESYVTWRLAQGWQFELRAYTDENDGDVETWVEEIAPAEYWTDRRSAETRECIVEKRHWVGPAWDRAVEEELAQRGYEYETV